MPPPARRSSRLAIRNTALETLPGAVLHLVMQTLDDPQSVGRLQVALKVVWVKENGRKSVADEVSLQAIQQYVLKGIEVTVQPDAGETVTKVWFNVRSSRQIQQDRAKFDSAPFGELFYRLCSSYTTCGEITADASPAGFEIDEEEWYEEYADIEVHFPVALEAGEYVRVPVPGGDHSIRVRVHQGRAANEGWSLAEYDYYRDRPVRIISQEEWEAPALVGNHIAFHPGYNDTPPTISTASSARGYLTLRQLWQGLAGCVSSNWSAESPRDNVIRGLFLEDVKRLVDRTASRRPTLFVENWGGGEDQLRDHFSKYGTIDEILLCRNLPEEFKEQYKFVNGLYGGTCISVPIGSQANVPEECTLMMEDRRKDVKSYYGAGPPHWPHDCSLCTCVSGQHPSGKHWSRERGEHGPDCLCCSFTTGADVVGCTLPFDLEKLACVNFSERSSVAAAVVDGLCTVSQNPAKKPRFDSVTTTIAGRAVRCSCAAGTCTDLERAREFDGSGVGGSQHRFWLCFGT